MSHRTTLASAVLCLTVLIGCNAPPLKSAARAEQQMTMQAIFNDNGGFATDMPTLPTATQTVVLPGEPTPVVPVPTRLPQSAPKVQNPAPVVNSNAPAPRTTADGKPVIDIYEVSKTLAWPGETITVKWQTTGKRVSLVMMNFDKSESPGAWHDLPPTGSMDIKIPDTAAITVYLALVASSDISIEKDSALTQTILLHCTAQWFFANAPEGCPTASRSWKGAAQHFEHGFMIWMPHETGWASHVLVFHENWTFKTIEDNWQPGMAESDPALVPPSGLYQPVRGFGLVWRNGNYMSSLGWATGPEFAFDGISQRKIVPSTETTPSYILGPDGVFEVAFIQGRWKVWDTD